MTHENIVGAVYQSVSAWACPNGENCDCDCRACAERLVKEYENAIRTESLAEALKPYDAESVEDLVRNVREKTIEEAREALIKMKKTCDSNGHDCDRCVYSHHSYHQNCADYVLEQMKEGVEND